MCVCVCVCVCVCARARVHLFIRRGSLRHVICFIHHAVLCDVLLPVFTGSARHLTSEPFYTSPHGYKLCARVYLNGDGTGLGSHLSLYIIVMKGDYDRVLSWPLSARVTLSLLDQGPSRTHHHHRFHPDARSSSFCRPVGEMNVASGCPQFIHLSGLERHGFVQDDCIVLRVFLDTSNIQGVDSPNFS